MQKISEDPDSKVETHVQKGTSELTALKSFLLRVGGPMRPSLGAG